MKKFAVVMAVMIGAFTACDKKEHSSPVTTAVDNLSPSSPSGANPNVSTLHLYDDGVGLTGDPDLNIQLASGLRSEQSGGAPEGSLYLVITDMDALTAALAVTFDRQTPNLTKDLSAFQSGKITFYIRLRRAFAVGELAQVAIYDNQFNSTAVTLSASQGFSGTSTDWQKITIPLSIYSSDLTTIWSPFHLRFESLQSNISFDLDEIRWVQ